MEVILESGTNVNIQLGLFEAILDLLLVNPIFLLGIVLIGIALFVIFRKNSSIPRVKTSILVLMLYYSV